MRVLLGQSVGFVEHYVNDFTLDISQPLAFRDLRMKKKDTQIKVTPALLSAVMTSLGQASTPKKTAAARRNGALGGRPRKTPVTSG